MSFTKLPMEEEQRSNNKQLDIMPSHPKGIGKYFRREADEKMSTNIRIMIIIGIFSLILIFIGTIILLNSYSPHATSVNSSTIITPTAPEKNDVILPTSATKVSMMTLADQMNTFTDSLASDEANFEHTVK